MNHDIERGGRVLAFAAAAVALIAFTLGVGFGTAL